MLFVHAAFVERPRRLGPAERSIVAQALEEVAGERGRRRDGQRRRVRLPVDGRDVELQLVVGLHQEQLRHAVEPDEEVHAELEIDPAAHLPRFEEQRLTLDLDRRRLRRSIPPDRQRQADVFLGLERGDRCPVRVAERRALGADRLNLGLGRSGSAAR